jgi:hypothetical protein
MAPRLGVLLTQHPPVWFATLAYCSATAARCPSAPPPLDAMADTRSARERARGGERPRVARQAPLRATRASMRMTQR